MFLMENLDSSVEFAKYDLRDLATSLGNTFLNFGCEKPRDLIIVSDCDNERYASELCRMLKEVTGRFAFYEDEPVFGDGIYNIEVGRLLGIFEKGEAKKKARNEEIARERAKYEKNVAKISDSSDVSVLEQKNFRREVVYANSDNGE